MSASPFISVVVATCYREPLALDCVRSICAQRYPNWEVLVVDQDPAQGLRRKIAEQFPTETEKIRYYFRQGAGAAGARGLGLRESNGEIVAFIDDDAVADSAWLDGIVEVFDKYPAAGMVAGVIHPIWVDDRPAWYPQEREFLLGLYDIGGEMRPLPAGDLPIGANMAGRKDALLAAGGFDQNFGPNYFHNLPKLTGEDSLLGERVLRAGLAIYYQPKARVHHRIEARKLSRKAFLEKHYWEGYSVMYRLKLMKDIQPPLMPHCIYHFREALRAAWRFLLARDEKGSTAPKAVLRMLALSQAAYQWGMVTSLRARPERTVSR
jgi:GT2 family glycosyltransferase